jgi:hypothetical protein
MQHYPPNDPDDPYPLSDLPTQAMPSLPPQQRSHNWWRRKSKGVQAAIGCGSLIVALLALGLAAAIGNAAMHSHASNSSVTPMATGASGNIVVAASVGSSPTGTSASSTATATSTTHGAGVVPGATPPLTPTSAPTSPSSTASPTSGPTAAPETPTPGRTPTPPRPTPTPTPSCQRVDNNPWCYNFTPGTLIYSPPATFCNYFHCVPGFWNGTGYVDECQDGLYSHSGGVAGDCSANGGVQQSLYSH